MGKRDIFKLTTLEQFYVWSNEMWSNEFVLLFIHSFTHSVSGFQRGSMQRAESNSTRPPYPARKEDLKCYELLRLTFLSQN